MLLHARMRRRHWVLPAVVAACVGAGGSARADDATETSDDHFVADDGHVRPFTASYREGYRPGRSDLHYFRAAAEMVALLAIGSALYYGSDDRWAGSDYSGVVDRFRHLRASFDTSTFNTNALGHPAAGSMYQLFARTNGHSIPVAFLYSFLSSATWEMLVEVPENPSVNDFVITPGSGLAIGELLVHTGDYFNSAPRPRWYHEVLGYVFGLSHRMHRALDGYKRTTTSLPTDSLGYSSYYWHRFDVLAGPMHLTNDVGASATGGQLRVQAEIVSIPGFLRPGRFAVNFSDGNFVEMLAQLGLGKDAQAGDLVVDANLFGRYAQGISESTHKGVASMFAFNTSARYADRFLLDRRDSYYFAQLAGPAVKLWAMSGDLVAKFDAAAHFDVGCVRSLAFPEYAARFGDAGASTVLKMKDYYFGIGGSVTARGTVSYKAVELGVRTFVGRYESIDRFDRFPEQVPRPIHTSDRVTELEGWAGIVPRDFPLQVRAFFEHIPRTSTMSSITTTRWDRRFGLTIGAHL